MAVDIDVAMAMDVDVAMLGMAIAMVGMAVVGMVVGLCMVVVVNVAVAVWGEENGGWRKLNHQHVNVQTSKFNFDT
jgi:hypothetical protein